MRGQVMSAYEGARSGLLNAVKSRTALLAGFTFASRVLTAAIGLLTSVVTAKALGPQGRGYFAVGVTIGAMAVQFANMGLHAANTRYVAKDARLVSPLLANSLLVGLGLGGLLSAALWAVFRTHAASSPLHDPALALALAYVPVGLTLLLLQNLLVGLNRIHEFNLIEIASRVLVLVLILGFLLTGALSLNTALSAALAGVTVGLVLVLARLAPSLKTLRLPSRALFRRCLNFGFRAYLVSVFGFVVLRADLLMVRYMLGPAEAGYYSVASSMGDILNLLPAAVATVVFPRLVQCETEVERLQATKAAATLLGIAMLGVAAVCCLMARPLVGILYGKAFLKAVGPFMILAAAMVFYGTNTLLSIHFAALGFPVMSILAWLLVAALNIGMNIIVIPRYGIMGAAVSSFVCYFAIFALHLLMLAKRRLSER
ncbi:MAG: oligosaccharide flippase family protein [Bryobacteraceae bacterium]